MRDVPETEAGAVPPPLPDRTDVLVVGAGPVGLALAASLARAGVDVLVIDRAQQPAATSRAIAVHARTLELLGPIGAAGPLVERGLPVPRFRLRERDRTLLTVDFTGLPTAYPYVLMLPQSTTEDILRGRLEAYGGRVHRPYELAALHQDADADANPGANAGAVTATTTTGQSVRARFVVGADGAHSRVREQAGIGCVGGTYPQTFVLADVRLEGGSGHGELFLAPEGLTLIAPLPDGVHRIVAATGAKPTRGPRPTPSPTAADLPETPKPPGNPEIQEIQGYLDARGPRRRPLAVEELVWSSRFRIHHRLAEGFRAGRVFLAGDAAHVHSPAGGQGMNIGIHEALDLADRLSAVLAHPAHPAHSTQRGTCPHAGADESILDAYDAERRPVARQIIAATDRMTRLVMIRNTPGRLLRNAALRVFDRLPAVRRTIARNLSELDTHPSTPETWPR